MTRKLLAALLLPLAACQDVPLDPNAPHTGPLQVSVEAAGTEFVKCGEEIPITATVTDKRGRPVSGLLLNFNVLEGGGHVFGGAALTNKNGVAQELWTVGGTANVRNTLAVRAVDPATGVGTTYFQQTRTTLSRIAFTSTRGGTTASIQVMNADGSRLRRLTEDDLYDYEPAWSTDGHQIAFVRSPAPGFFIEIYLMNADGSGVRRLTHNQGYNEHPTLSPDGRQIAFTRFHREISVMNADGSGIRRLAWTEFDLYLEPAWSPDARQIAFTSDRDEGRTFSIHVMNADGSGIRRLTDDTDYDYEPAWSPDGRQIAFRSKRGGTTYSIQVMNADGTGIRRLTDDAADDDSPAWSPDGRQIAFTSKRGGTTYSIQVMNADGTGIRRLTDDAADDYAPAWSGCTP